MSAMLQIGLYVEDLRQLIANLPGMVKGEGLQYNTGGNKVWKNIFSTKVIVKVIRLSTLVSL